MAARCSNLIVTATPARKYYIRKEWIQPGCFIAAIGADSPGKQELDPRLVASSVVVTDIKVQAYRVGESQHAISQGVHLGRIGGNRHRPENVPRLSRINHYL